MDMRSLARPAAKLATASRSSRLLPLTATRGHKTTARTKRALKIAPHDSFLPDRATSFPAADSIIYNPPASEASVFHTPFLFLPPNDPRRDALTRLRASNPEATKGLGGSAASEEELPPAMKYTRRVGKNHLDEKDFEEMRRLRNEDPLTWSVNALAKKFQCSPIIAKIAAPAPSSHKQWLQEKLERKKERWGPIKTQARDDRRRRAEMLYRGEI